MKIAGFRAYSVIVLAAMGMANSASADPTFTQLATVHYLFNQNLVVDLAGNIYGAESGSVFELSGPTHQTLTTVISGLMGPSQVIADSSGNLYVATPNGTSTQSVGTVFELSGPNHQTQTTLASFGYTTSYGDDPAGLAFDANGNLYGVTGYSGSPESTPSIFRLSGANLQTLSYQSVGLSGAGGLALDRSGDIFAFTYSGGSPTLSMFNTSLQGSVATLHTFNSATEGEGSQAGLTVDSAGNVYGTLQFGGPNNAGGVFELSGANHQTFTLLTSFSASGARDPAGGLTIDANGNIWGTTGGGGLYNDGTVYGLSGPNHQTLTTIYSYNGTSDSTDLEGGLTADAYGNRYGEAAYVGYGDIFELTNTGFAVPEPTGVSLLAVATVALLRRRGRGGNRITLVRSV